MKLRFPALMLLVIIFTSMLAACGDASTLTPQATQAPSTTAPAATATEAPATGSTDPTAEPTAAATTDTGSTSSDGKVFLTVSDQQQSTWVRNFNPFASDNRWPTAAGIYEPMFIYNIATGKIEPWLATEWAWNSDNTELTFTIRDGVKWSDGEAFSSKDVAYTLNLMKDNEKLQGNGRAAMRFIDSVAADGNKVVVKFKEVSTIAMYDIGHQMIVPEHIWSKIADPVTFTNENPVATGPFTEIIRFQDQIWELGKNPNYWQAGKPYIDGIRQPAYPSNDAANLATINGENDLASNFIPDVENTYVAKDPENNHYWFPPVNAPVMLLLNTTKAPFNDPNVRKAISMGFDRQQITEIATYSYNSPSDATGLPDSFADWKNPEAVAAGDWVNFDVEKANKMLDEAGLTRGADGIRVLPDGTPMTYDINVVSGWTDWVTADQIIAESLKEIGINATTRTYDFSAWFDKVQKGEFDMSIGWSNNAPTPLQFYRGLMSGETADTPIGEANGDNWHRYGNPKVDELYSQFVKTSDPAEQKKIMNEIQMIFVQEAPAIPIMPNIYWGEYNTKRFTGFPTAENPYVLLSSFAQPDRLILLTTIKPK